MRYIIAFLLLYLPTILEGQELRTERDVLYLKKRNGDTIEISAQSRNGDSALVTVNYLKNKKRKRLQQFKTVFSSPLQLSSTSFDNKQGIYIKYDPAHRLGNSFLYLFDDAKNLFREINGFRELGKIYHEKYGTRDYFYSYTSCGCDDHCWISKLFTIKNYKLYTLARLSCDCNKLISTYKLDANNSSCEAYNFDQKFEKIAKYWRTKIKNGG